MTDAFPPREISLPPGDFAGYIFDCDGTLAASMRPHYEAWKQALAAHGAKFDFTWKLFLTHAGRGTRHFVELINQLFGEHLEPEAVALTQDRLLRQLQNDIRPVPEVVALARRLAAEGQGIAVASGGNRATVRDTLKRIGVGDLFAVVVTIEDVAHGKPAPDTFFEAARRLQVAPARCLVLGDSVLDVEAARAAGMAWVKLEPR